MVHEWACLPSSEHDCWALCLLLSSWNLCVGCVCVGVCVCVWGGGKDQPSPHSVAVPLREVQREVPEWFPRCRYMTTVRVHYLYVCVCVCTVRICVCVCTVCSVRSVCVWGHTLLASCPWNSDGNTSVAMASPTACTGMTLSGHSLSSVCNTSSSSLQAQEVTQHTHNLYTITGYQK